jgi:hypothetical protein
MEDQESLSRSECLALLRTASVGRIAYSERALPAIVTVSFALLEDVIVVRADARSSWAASLRGTVVAFEAGSDRVGEECWSVTCVGRATLVDDGEADLGAVAVARGWSLDADYVQIQPELLRGWQGAAPHSVEKWHPPGELGSAGGGHGGHARPPEELGAIAEVGQTTAPAVG